MMRDDHTLMGDRKPDIVEDITSLDNALRTIQNTQWENRLAQYVRERFRDARAARQREDIDADMSYGAHAYRAKYSPSELSQLDPGVHVYMPITQTKCRALQNWMADIMQNAIDRPFTLNPTPVVDVPQHLEDVAVERLTALFNTGEIDVDELTEMIEQARGLALDIAHKSAKQACERMGSKIEDQLAEGGWRDTYDQFVVDLSTMPAAIIRGPTQEKKMRLSHAFGDVTQVEEDVFTFRRVSPFDFFPAPSAASVEDAAYLIERMRLRGSQMSVMKRMVGAQPEVISSLLAAHPEGYDPWEADMSDHARQELEAKDLPSSSGPDRDYVVMVYTGEIPVRLANEYGLKLEEDHQDFLQVELWTCGRYVLRAMVNPYPLGKRPYYVTGFQRRAGSIWFDSLPVILRDTQRLCNAAVRAMVKNMAFSAGPIGEVDLGAIPMEENLTEIEPYRLYKVSKDPLSPTGSAFSFTTIPSTSVHLMRVYDRYSVEADNVSGIPAFVTGNPDVAGAGRTLGGLSMLMGNAAKGIKRVVSMSDNLVVQPMVEMMYAINMLFSNDDSLKADAQVVARGAAGLLQKELSQSRAIELLQVLVQPVVAQSGFVPPEAIPQLLRDVAAGMGYDPDIIPDPTAQQDIITQLQNSGINVGQPPTITSPGGGGAPIPGVDGRSQPAGDPSAQDVVPAA